MQMNARVIFAAISSFMNCPTGDLNSESKRTATTPAPLPHSKTLPFDSVIDRTGIISAAASLIFNTLAPVYLLFNRDFKLRQQILF
jgi:hypothetical protein